MRMERPRPAPAPRSAARRKIRMPPDLGGPTHVAGPQPEPAPLSEFRFGVNNWGDNFTSPRTNTNFDINSLGIGQYHVVGDGNRNLTPLEQGVPTMSFSGSGFSLGDVQGR